MGDEGAFRQRVKGIVTEWGDRDLGKRCKKASKGLGIPLKRLLLLGTGQIEGERKKKRKLEPGKEEGVLQKFQAYP